LSIPPVDSEEGIKMSKVRSKSFRKSSYETSFKDSNDDSASKVRIHSPYNFSEEVEEKAAEWERKLNL
jgi:hypothetical protein